MKPKTQNTVAAPSTQQKRPTGGGFRHRAISAIRPILACILLCAVFYAWHALSDFPASWERRISDALSTRTARVEVNGISLGFLLTRLTIDTIKVLPVAEGATKAAVSISDLRVGLRIRSLKPSPEWIRDVRIDSLEIDHGALSSLSGGNSKDGPAIPDFKPIGICIKRASALGLEVHDFCGRLGAADGMLVLDEAAVSFDAPGEYRQTLRGRVGVEPAAPTVDASVSGTIDFAKFVPVLRQLGCDGIANELAKAEFPTVLPGAEFHFHMSPVRKARSMNLSVKSGPMLYNGVRLSGFDAAVRADGGETWKRIDIDPFALRRPEGVASGNLTIDLGAGTLSFDCLSSMDPVRAIEMAGFADAARLQEIEVAGSPEVHVYGTLGLGNATGQHTSARMSATVPQITVRGFEFSNVSISGGMNGAVIDFPKITAGAMGGSIEGAVAIDLGDGKSEQTISARLAISNVPESSWAVMLGREADAQAGGRLDVSATYDGPLSEMAGMVPTQGRGTFAADLREANIFKIPLFAGLTGVLSKYIPGVDLLVSQNAAHIRATLDSGRWNFSSLSVSGAGISIDGSGTAAADGTDLNIAARVRLLNKKTWLGRIIRQLLRPISGLFGVRATGSIAAPKWTMSPFSRSTAK